MEMPESLRGPWTLLGHVSIETAKQRFHNGCERRGWMGSDERRGLITASLSKRSFVDLSWQEGQTDPSSSVCTRKTE